MKRGGVEFVAILWLLAALMSACAAWNQGVGGSGSEASRPPYRERETGGGNGGGGY